MNKTEREDLEQELQRELENILLDEILLEDETPTVKSHLDETEYQRIDIAQLFSQLEKEDTAAQEKRLMQSNTWLAFVEAAAQCEQDVFHKIEQDLNHIQKDILQKENSEIDPTTLRSYSDSTERETHIPTKNDPPDSATTYPIQTLSEILPDLKIQDRQAAIPIHQDPTTVSNAVENCTEIQTNNPQSNDSKNVNSPREKLIHRVQRIRELERKRQNEVLEILNREIFEQEQKQIQEKARQADRAREEKERLLAASEDRQSYVLREHFRESEESKLMSISDSESKIWNHHYLQELRKIIAERKMMEAEEMHGRARLQLEDEIRQQNARRERAEREAQRREKLITEKNRIKRAFGQVLDELYFKMEEKRNKRLALENLMRQVQMKECVAMRKEEMEQRQRETKILAQHQGILRYNRLNMEMEEVLSRRLREFYLRIEMSLQMELDAISQEDTIGRLLRVEERTRKIELEYMVVEDRKSQLAQMFWKSKELEYKRLGFAEKIARNASRKLIYLCFNEWLAMWYKTKRAVCHIEHFWTLIQSRREAEAASVVQSVFRGFYVRRKFMAALEMAKIVDEDEFEYGEVNLDDFLQVPQELQEDWGNPTLPVEINPVFCGEILADAEQNQCDPNQEVCLPEDFHDAPHDFDEDMDAKEVMETPRRSEKVENQKKQLADEWGFHDSALATTLWKRMKRAQKMKKVPEERSKNQDPTYRVKKILRAARSASQTSPTKNNQSPDHNEHAKKEATTSSVMWSFSGKKAKRVKLPSLVDRLRGKTAAAR